MPRKRKSNPIVEIILTELIALVTYSLLNFLWLGAAAKDLYHRTLPSFVSDQPDQVILFILAIAVVSGLVYFVIYPARRDTNLALGLRRAAIYGLLLSAFYNLSNLANLTSWPTNLVVIDIIWGGVVMMAVTAITINLLQRRS